MSRRRGASTRTSGAAAELLQRIENRTARLGVIGLGYVGLPLAVEFAQAGFHLHGIDVDAARVARLRKGRSYVQDVPHGDVRAVVRSGHLLPTTDFDVLRRVDAVNVCVPTPLSKQRDPDVSYIMAASREVARTLHRGMLVVLESTTYPGTTEELILPLLEESGMVVGRDFFLAFSPERVDPGNPRFRTRNIPKVVGGVTPACTEVAVALYRQRLEQVVPVSSPQVAEMVKLLENTFRSVNIGLVNELALMCNRMKIDVWEVIEAAATKPFGFMPFYPGPGLGGHCQDGDEFLFVRRAGGMDAVRMKDLADGRRARRIGDVEVMPLDVEVLSFDLERKQACFRPATHLFRRWHPRRVTLRSAEGRSLTVTDGHPLIVQNGHGLEVRRADRLDSDSRLVVVEVAADGAPESIRPDERSDRIRDVVERDGGCVYSIEVPGTQTYVTSFGLVSHNCIPIDPFYLSWKARASGFEARFIELAGHVNAHMPEHVVDLVAQSLNQRGLAVQGSRVLVLGVAYKAGVDDIRESPSLDIMQTLVDRGARVEYSDPYVPSLSFAGRRLASMALTPGRLRRFDCVVIATAHPELPYADIVRHARGVVDTRNALKGSRSKKIIRL